MRRSSTAGAPLGTPIPSGVAALDAAYNTRLSSHATHACHATCNVRVVADAPTPLHSETLVAARRTRTGRRVCATRYARAASRCWHAPLRHDVMCLVVATGMGGVCGACDRYSGLFADLPRNNSKPRESASRSNRCTLSQRRSFTFVVQGLASRTRMHQPNGVRNATCDAQDASYHI